MSDLQTFREQIDAIDDELIALLKKRIEIVGKVGEHKRKQGCEGLFIRPGREGKMHRRIFAAFKDSPYAPQAMLGIWRLLITASTHHESPLSLGILGGTDAPELLAQAQGYFGDFLERRNYASAGSLLSDLHDKRVAIGIAPYPSGDANWWHALLHYRSGGCYIFAQLPAWQTRLQDRSALALGAVTPEASGEDVSYFALQVEETTSTSRLHSLLKQEGFEAEVLNAQLAAPLRSVLLKLDGFVDANDEKMQRVCNQLGSNDCVWLGAHPKPIAMGTAS